jgi:hypothetical protein
LPAFLMLLSDRRGQHCAGSERVLLCCCVAVLLCCCVWHCAALDGRCGCQRQYSHSSGGDAQEFEKRLWCCLMSRRAARASSSHRRRPRTLCVRCGVCVDARDARGCESTLHLGCETSSCCCSACASLAAFTRCLQLLCRCCCCCVPSACLHVHGVAVVA